MRVITIALVCLLAACVISGANGQRRGGKKTTTEAPAYDDDYDESGDYDGDSDDGKDSAKDTKKPTVTTTTAKPVEEEPEETPKGPHSFLKNRKRLGRPSPHPAIKAKPTLPSFIKHPVNVDDLPPPVPAEDTILKANFNSPARPRHTPSSVHKPSSRFSSSKKAKAESTTAAPVEEKKVEDKKPSRFASGKAKPTLRSRFRGQAPPPADEA